jgi:hypothetical protein
MMAETTTATNNKSVSFSGKTEREMPMESKAQNAAMHAAAEGESTIGIPEKVGKKFVAESHGQKVKRLPQHVRKKAKRAMKQGLISEKAAKRHLGGY